MSTNASKEEEDKKEQEDILARWMNQSSLCRYPFQLIFLFLLETRDFDNRL